MDSSLALVIKQIGSSVCISYIIDMKAARHQMPAEKVCPFIKSCLQHLCSMDRDQQTRTICHTQLVVRNMCMASFELKKKEDHAEAIDFEGLPSR